MSNPAYCVTGTAISSSSAGGSVWGLLKHETLESLGITLTMCNLGAILGLKMVQFKNKDQIFTLNCFGGVNVCDTVCSLKMCEQLKSIENNSSHARTEKIYVAVLFTSINSFIY